MTILISGSLSIRKMDAHDIDAVIALDKLSFTLPWPESAFHYEVEKNPAARCWVAEIRAEQENPKLAGMAILWLILDEAHIATIAVDPTYRQHHIGQRLLAYALVDAWERGARKAFLEVRKSNLAARELYSKFGFVEAGVRKWYYQDNREDAILLNLEDLDKARLIGLL